MAGRIGSIRAKIVLIGSLIRALRPAIVSMDKEIAAMAARIGAMSDRIHRMRRRKPGCRLLLTA
ncbi:MAG: hypothetical protein V4710_17330 [Verrucomicrobiota bacterium]